MATRLKCICHLIIHSGDSNRNLYEVTPSLHFILFKLIYILKDFSNEHFVRTTSKLRYFV